MSSCEPSKCFEHVRSCVCTILKLKLDGMFTIMVVACSRTCTHPGMLPFMFCALFWASCGRALKAWPHGTKTCYESCSKHCSAMIGFIFEVSCLDVQTPEHVLRRCCVDVSWPVSRDQRSVIVFKVRPKLRMLSSNICKKCFVDKLT